MHLQQVNQKSKNKKKKSIQYVSQYFNNTENSAEQQKVSDS